MSHFDKRRPWPIPAAVLLQATLPALAEQFTSDLCFGKTATVDVRDTDRYGRTVAVATVAGKTLNRELVRAGLAWWYRKYAPDDRELQTLEAQARADRRGLWSDPRPMAPWDFRAGAPPSTSSVPPVALSEATVYVPRSGRRYHRADCRTLRATPTPTTRAGAEAQGYTPCRSCRP